MIDIFIDIEQPHLVLIFEDLKHMLKMLFVFLTFRMQQFCIISLVVL